jgi:hypothetical protein
MSCLTEGEEIFINFEQPNDLAAFPSRRRSAAKRRVDINAEPLEEEWTIVDVLFEIADSWFDWVNGR